MLKNMQMAMGAEVNKDDKETQSMEEELGTLVRLSIDFCVSISDSTFLFYDLINLLKEYKLEDKFLEQLKPFIMAGRFQTWELPKEILEDNVIKYF